MFGKKDPVCGVKVKKSTEFKAEYNGKTYYFDSEACMATFKAGPEAFLKKKSRGGLFKPPSQEIPKCCHEIKK
jgi:Cu+-exporting ATPase